MFIKAENLSKNVIADGQRLNILQNITLNIEQYQSHVIQGVSGSGKTTLLGLLAGLDSPSEGRVLFEGQDLNLLNENQRAALRLAKIGFIFQNFLLLPNLSALENVLLPLELKNSDDALAKAEYFLEKVGLQHRLHHHPKTLSGGEQQRVAIARAFAVQPEVLFADEPTANLDEKTAQGVLLLLFELCKSMKTTLVCVTHDPHLAKLSDKQFHIKEGQIT